MSPNQEGLRLLFRATPITDEDWLNLVEARKQLIKPHLDTFTLLTFGQTGCLENGTFLHSINMDSPECVGGEFDLNTLGIFRYNWESKIKIAGALYIWGLTRKAQWIVAGEI